MNRNKITEREHELHTEASRLAEILSKQFYEEFKKTKLSILSPAEALAMATDCCSMSSSHIIGSMFHTIIKQIPEFITENLIIETMSRAFKINFESYIKIQKNL